MVSTNTQSNGVVRQKRTLIFQQFSAKYQTQSIPALTKWFFAMNLLMKRLFLISILFLGLASTGLLHAEEVSCTLKHPCGSTITINLDSVANGVTGLMPQDFFDGGTCGVITVSPNSISCANVGSGNELTVTITESGVDPCVGNPIKVLGNDVSGPAITCPADVSVDCSVTGATAATISGAGIATATDYCSPSGSITFSQVTVSGMTPPAGVCDTLKRTWTATDNLLNSSTCLQTIIQTDGTAPTLTFTAGAGPADVSVDCSTSVPAQLATPADFGGTDNCSVSATVTDVTVGQGTDPNMCNFYNYTINRTYTATDGCGNSTEHTQVITISDNKAPTTTPAPAATPIVASPTTTCTATVNLSVAAMDNCAASANVQGFFEVKLQSSGAVVASGGGLNATGTYNVGLYDFEFTVIDPCGNDSTIVYVVDVVDNSNPIARCKSNVNVTVDALTGMSLITAASIDDNSTDNCTPQNQLTFTVNRLDGTGGDKVFCADITSPLSPLTMPVELIVTDGNNNSNTCSTILTALPSNPSVACTNISVNLNAAGNYNLLAAANAADLALLTSNFADACSSPLTYAFSQTVFTCADIGANSVTATVTNSASLSSTCTAMITVNDTAPPVQSCTASYSAYLDANGQITPDPRWLLNGAHEIYMTSGNDGSGTTGITEYRLTSPNGATFSINWNYATNDTRGASEDRLRYRILGSNFVILKDNSVSFNSGTEPVTLLAGETLIIQLFSTDNMGGRAEANLDLTTSLSAPGDLYEANWVPRLIRSDGVAFIAGNAIETMDCTPAYDLTFSSNPSVLTCDNMPSESVKIYFTDAAGNIDSCNTTVNIIDNLAPDFMCADFTAQLDQSGNVTVEPGWFLAGSRSLYIESDSAVSNTSGTVDHTVRIKTATNLQFRWDFTSSDTTNTGEVFGYLLNGNFVSLSSGTSHTNMLRNVSVNANDIFGFRIQSDNNSFDSWAEVRPSNFTLDNDFDPVFWSKSNTNNIGSCSIHGSVMDNCSNYGDLTLTVSGSTTYSCGAASPVSVTITVADGAMPTPNSSLPCMANLYIVDNEAPIAVCPSSYTVTLGSNGEVDLNALPATMNIINNSIDNCIPSVLQVFPDALSVSPGQDSTKLTCNNIGANTVSYTVKDPSGNTATCTNTITVQEGTPPQIVCPADITVDCMDGTTTADTGYATASDNCGVATIDSVDVLDLGPFTFPNCRTITRTFTAEDGSGNKSTCIQVITVEDNIVPTLTTPTGFSAAITAECAMIPARPVMTYSDNCSGVMLLIDTLDSRIDTVGGVDTFLVLPSAMGYYNYTITREWVVIDACGNSVTQTQTVAVSDNQPPMVGTTFPTSLTVNTDAGVCQGTVTSLALKTSDIMDCADFQYLTITNNSAYATSGGADASGVYPLGITNVTFTITDPAGNPTNHVVAVEVKDVETPNINCATANTIDVVLSSAGVGNLSVVQIDQGSNDPCGLASLTLSPNTFDCTHVGSQTVTLTGVDNNNNVGVCTTMVNVKTNATSSVTISCPAAATVTCPTIPDPSVTGTALFTSACGTGSLSYTDSPLSSPSCGTITRTWTITDGTNTDNCMQIITMVDATAPTFTSAIPTYSIQECMVPALDVLNATDACKGNFTVTPADTAFTTGAFAFDIDPDNCGHYSYNVSRTWTAEDCANQTVRTRTIRVRDTEAPVISFPNPLVVPTDANSCDAVLNVDLKNYVTDCAADANLTFSIDGAAGGNSVISGTYAEGTHSFTLDVMDPCGNAAATTTINIKVEDQTTPTAACVLDVVVVLDNTGNGVLDINKIDSGSSDNCTSPANLIRTAMPSTFTTADINNSPIQVTLTVEDQAGLTNFCTANATVVGGTLFDASHVSLPVGGTGTIPVSVANFNNVTSFGFNIDVTDATVATATALSNINPALAANGTFAPSATANGYSVLWTATSTGSPITLTDGSVLFDLDATVVGNAGDMSDVDITANTVMKLIGGVATPDGSTALDGSITVFNPSSTYTYSVEIKTEEGAAVANANVAQTGGMNASASTNTAGTASFTANSGMTATFTPDKNTDWKNGITVNDAFLVLQHPNPTSTFSSGYKNIAADANKDNIITGNDAILIFQLAVDPAFTAIPGNTSWRFIHETPDLSTTPNPWSPTVLFSESYSTTATMNETVKFVGVKTGDVDASANPLLRPINNVSYTESFEFLLENKWVENAGERIEVPFKAKDFKGINGYQYTIDFEIKQLEYVDMIPGALPNLSSYNFKDALAANGQLTTGWLSMNAIDFDDETVLFTLVFDTKSANFELKDAISASDNLIPMEVIESNGLLKNNVELVFQSGVSSTDDTYATNFDLRQNVPNPFENQTVIGFNLPQASAIQMNFMDASGRLLHQVKGDYTQGYNEVTVSKQALPATGVVLYQLQTEFGTLVKKMVILE